MFDRKVKKTIRHVGYQILVQRERPETNSKGKHTKVAKFRQESGIFDTRSSAEKFATRYFSHNAYRIVGVRLDFTPNHYPSGREAKAET